MPVMECSECRDLAVLNQQLDWAVDNIEEMALVPNEEKDAAIAAINKAARAVRDLQRAHDAWRSNN